LNAEQPPLIQCDSHRTATGAIQDICEKMPLLF
jgi:hypothetical protein